MHGIFRFLGNFLDDKTTQSEKKILSGKFKQLLGRRFTGKPTEELLKFMRAAMEEIGEKDNPDNKSLPAGYTYLGQLIAHDISVHRFLGDVKPALRLRTLYGLGPGMAPYLYEYKPLQDSGLRFRGVKFSLEEYETDFGVQVFDVPRHKLNQDKFMPERSHSIPLMADARNDQNFILSQLLVKFAQIHNFLVDIYHQPAADQQGELFKTASAALVALYQDIILHDYLPKILFDEAVVDLLKDSSRKNFVFYTGDKGKIHLSEVFTRAAFRFGHSMVRPLYHTYPKREELPIFGNGSDLRGFVRDTRRAVDWNMFFGWNNKGKVVQSAKAFNHLIALPMTDLPFLKRNNNSIVNINLNHSVQNFPDGMAFYKALHTEMGKLFPLVSPFSDKEKETLKKWTPEELGRVIQERFPFLTVQTAIPLWLFLLLEAEIIADGKTMGPLGSRIIAEQLIWSMLDDPESVLNQPDLFPADLGVVMGKTTMFDIIRWVAPATIKSADDGVAGRRASLLPEDTGEQAYHGNEFHKVASEVDFNVYINAVNSTIKRAQILGNGFYDINSPRDENYPDLIKNGMYQEPGGRARQQIRVYVSQRTLLYNLGFDGKEDDATNNVTIDNNIKGLLFIFGLSNEHTQPVFTVRRLDFDGKVPQDIEDLVYFTDKKLLVKPNGACLDENLDSVAETILPTDHFATLTGQFIKDGFGMLKSTGMPQAVVIKRKVLLALLNVVDTVPAGSEKVEEVAFWLSAAKGHEIIQTHRLFLPEGEPQDTVPESLFFNLTWQSVKMENGSPRVLYSENTRPYPYWCYKG